MIDTKSKLVLKILAKECQNGNYKIIEVADIIMALPRKLRMDTEAVQNTLSYLERQDLISIKYDDDGVYCLSVLPYGFQILEIEPTKKERTKEGKNRFIWIFYNFCSALLGTIIGVIISYFVLKLF